MQRFIAWGFMLLCVSGSAAPLVAGTPGDPAHRQGDEVLVCGKLYHTGTPVVLFSDPGGYDGSKHTAGPVTRPVQSTPGSKLTETVRGGNLTLDQLRHFVDQFVLHYDAEGISKECYRVLERRRLSVHFMLDLDGTVYQCVDLREDCFHATIANSRSIGVEIANVGAWEGIETIRQKEWYSRRGNETLITIPSRFGSVRTRNWVGHPAEPAPVGGVVQGRTRLQYDYTLDQYAALSHLGATLCTLFPKIRPDYPRTPQGMRQTGKPAYPFAESEQQGVLINHVLPKEQYDVFQGILGHYHVQLDKEDPGPAMQWEKLMLSIRAFMTPEAKTENVKWRHKPVGLSTEAIRADGI